MKPLGSTARGAANTLFLGSAIVLPWSTITAQTVQEQALVSAQACSNFSHEAGDGGIAASSLSPWRASDCVDVWSAWSRTIPAALQQAYPDQQLLRESAAQMRRRGSPCLVESTLPADGVGSMTMRHLAAWMFAEEVGCDWVVPSWGTPRADGGEDGDGASLYCHTAATTEEKQRGFNASAEEVEEIVHRCSVTNWLEYFNFKATAVELPVTDSFRVVEVDKSSSADLESAVAELEPPGFESLERQRLKLVFSRSHASDYFVALGSWDDRKRRAVREVLRVLRNNFHQFPRPWYNQTPDCHFESAELNFALHLRLGDRRDIEQATLEYFQLLDNFMEAVTEGVVGKGHNAPTFHVFSETLFPCPCEEDGTFLEFPVWPVEMDQISTCIHAKRPGDCPEKRAGASSCRPSRSGVFRVRGRPLLLHVGDDAANALSCMIQADGLLMGCSTFGQLAGILNEGGISFFSTECGGLGTAVQYKMVPPLAVAERGHMWVPVAGSWRDPVLRSSDVFMAALEELLKAKGMSE